MEDNLPIEESTISSDSSEQPVEPITINDGPPLKHHDYIKELGDMDDVLLGGPEQIGDIWKTTFMDVERHKDISNDTRVDAITNYIKILQQVGNYSNRLLLSIQDKMSKTANAITILQKDVSERKDDNIKVTTTAQQLETLQDNLSIYENDNLAEDSFVKKLKSAFVSGNLKDFETIQEDLRREGEKRIEEQARQVQKELLTIAAEGSPGEGIVGEPKGVTDATQSVIQDLKRNIEQQFADREEARNAQVELLKEAREKNVEDAIGVDWTGMFFDYLNKMDWMGKPDLQERINIIKNYKDGDNSYSELLDKLNETTREDVDNERTILTSEQQQNIINRLNRLKEKMIEVLEKQITNNKELEDDANEKVTNAKNTAINEASELKEKINTLENELATLAKIYLGLTKQLQNTLSTGKEQENVLETIAFDEKTTHTLLINKINSLFIIDDKGYIIPNPTQVDRKYLTNSNQWNNDFKTEFMEKGSQKNPILNDKLGDYSRSNKPYIKKWQNYLKTSSTSSLKKNIIALEIIYDWLKNLSDKVKKDLGQREPEEVVLGTGLLNQTKGPFTQTEALGSGAVMRGLEERLQQARGNRSEVPPRTLSAFQSLGGIVDRAAVAREAIQTKDNEKEKEFLEKMSNVNRWVEQRDDLSLSNSKGGRTSWQTFRVVALANGGEEEWVKDIKNNNDWESLWDDVWENFDKSWIEEGVKFMSGLKKKDEPFLLPNSWSTFKEKAKRARQDANSTTAFPWVNDVEFWGQSGFEGGPWEDEDKLWEIIWNLVSKSDTDDLSDNDDDSGQSDNDDDSEQSDNDDDGGQSDNDDDGGKSDNDDDFVPPPSTPFEGGKKTQRKRRHKKSKTLKSVIKKKPKKPKKPKRRLAKRKSKRTFRKQRKINQKTMKA